jgi:O-antigen/teichoic acid export membrane protein
MIIVPMAYLQVSGQSMRFVAVGLIRLLLQVTFNVYFLVVLQLGVKAVLLSTMLTNLIIGVALLGYFLSHFGVSMSRATMHALLRFGLPLVAVNVATFISTFGDRYFLKAAADTTAVGIYSLAYQFGFLLAMVGYVPFITVWEPARFAIAKRPDRDDIYAKGFIYFNLLLLSMAVIFALFVPDGLRVMAARSYWRAADLVPLILVAYVMQGWTEIHELGIMMRERTELLTWANWIAALVAVTGYALLIPRYLGLGAAVATVLAFGVREALVYFWSQRLWPVRYRWAPVLRLAAVAVTVCIARRFVPERDLLGSLGWSAVLLGVYGVGLWNAGVLTPQERESAYRAIRSPRATLVRFLAGPDGP